MRRLLERRVIKGALSDDDDATDVSDDEYTEHGDDDDEFDDNDRAKTDEVIGAVGFDCEGGVD